MKIVLRGHIPSKKNLLRRRRNGGMYRDADVAKQIGLLTLQAKAQWIGRDPLIRPKAEALFMITRRNADIDNKWTTVLDCLRDAGVLKNDNAMNGPRPVTYDWILGPTEGCVITLETA